MQATIVGEAFSSRTPNHDVEFGGPSDKRWSALSPLRLWAEFGSKKRSVAQEPGLVFLRRAMDARANLGCERPERATDRAISRRTPE